MSSKKPEPGTTAPATPLPAAPAAPVVIMKGGTTSAAYDREMAERKASAEQRRDAEERRHAAQGVHSGPEGVDVGRIGSHSFLSGAPRLILYYMNRDKTVRQECKSEITFYDHPREIGKMDMMFAMVCPRCLERGLPQGECQMLVRESHRKFWIDDRKKGELVMLEDPWGRPDPVIICGTVTVEDIVRCNNFNCDFAVRIADSCVYEV